MLAREIWEVVLVSKDNYEDKDPSRGHSVTGGSHKGSQKKYQPRFAVRSVKEPERWGSVPG